MAKHFYHPATDELTIDSVLYALSDPYRRNMVFRLMGCSGMNCTEACEDHLSASTISFHTRILREAGLIRSEKRGVSVINTVRKQDIEKRFPAYYMRFFNITRAPKQSSRKNMPRHNDQSITIPDTGFVDIGPFQLQYRIEGIGAPIMVIGSTIQYPPTFSQQLRKQLKFIFVDHKGFVIPQSTVDNSEYELDVLIDDVERIRQTLNLNHMIVLGHSGNSFIALEYAKKYPQHVSHVVMLGIAPNLSPASKTAAEQYWQDSVDPERKAAMERNMRELSDEQITQLPNRSTIYPEIFTRHPQNLV